MECSLNTDIDWFYMILHRMTYSQILPTCDPQYSQGHVPFKFLQFLIISRQQGKKMALESLNVYTTSHPLRQTSLYVSCHLLPDRILEVAISLAHWEISLKLPFKGMSSEPHNGVKSLDLILMRLLNYHTSFLLFLECEVACSCPYKITASLSGTDTNMCT